LAGFTGVVVSLAGVALPRPLCQIFLIAAALFFWHSQPTRNIVGLPDKAVSEAKERVRAALVASGLALPARRITVNLAPADLPKEGSHYDLPIALGLMGAIGAIPPDALSGFTVLGELALDGSIAPVAGVLPAAIRANGRGQGLICPGACGSEAAWASPEIEIIAAQSLMTTKLMHCWPGRSSHEWVIVRPSPLMARQRLNLGWRRVPQEAVTILC
jgi:hypothetical protein